MNKIYKIYQLLYKTYGAQGWWPFINTNGYHILDYTFPKNKDEVFEVCELTRGSRKRHLKALNNAMELRIDGTGQYNEDGTEKMSARPHIFKTVRDQFKDTRNSLQNALRRHL